jgi:DNA-binding MarR family transcriptional regulator
MHLEKEQQQVLTAARDQGISAVLLRNAIARRLGLNSTDSECLSFLGIRGAATPTEIAQYTGLTTGSTTAMLDRLEIIGYTKRTPNPNDRRGVIVTLTPSWMQAASPLIADIQKAHEQLIVGYTKEELAVITDFLTKFTKNVQEQTKKIAIKAKYVKN